jgi:hypothetical protein
MVALLDGPLANQLRRDPRIARFGAITGCGLSNETTFAIRIEPSLRIADRGKDDWRLRLISLSAFISAFLSAPMSAVLSAPMSAVGSPATSSATSSPAMPPVSSPAVALEPIAAIAALEALAASAALALSVLPGRCVSGTV